MADQNRNLNPHAEARLAMAIWGEEYAYKQTGGSMDFWDSRTDQQKALCVSIIDDVMKAMANKGRASDDSRSSKVDRFELGRDSHNRPVMNKNDHGDWVSYQDYETARGFEAMWKAHRDELLGQIDQEPYKAATDRISEYLNRVPGAYQADDGRRYWTREQVLEAVKECGTPPPQPQMVGSGDGPTIRYNGTGSDAIREIKAGERIAELEAALRPFVRAFERKRDEYSKRHADRDLGYANFDKMPDDWAMEKLAFTMGAFRRARAALSAPEAEG